MTYYVFGETLNVKPDFQTYACNASFQPYVQNSRNKVLCKHYARNARFYTRFTHAAQATQGKSNMF